MWGWAGHAPYISSREVILTRPVLIVHGGAWYIPPSEVESHVRGCRQAAKAAWDLLEHGGSALDAVEAAVRCLEDDPAFDAGRGSYLNREGRVQMDAIVMDGRGLSLGAVAAVERVRHPVTLARMVMEQCEHNFVVGLGAEALAETLGLALCDPAEMLGRRDCGMWSPPHMGWGDTVGAVAMDAEGHLAVATSTGGTPDKWPGRVGDSPLVGCGAYADDQAGAASATGSGEALMRIVISKAAVDLMCDGMPAQMAAEAVIRRLWTRVRGYGGIILVDAFGRVGLAHNTPHMSYAWVTTDDGLVSGSALDTDAPGRAEALAAIRKET